MDHRSIVAAGLLTMVGLSTAELTPAAAQSVQEAQRQLFICMQKAKNMQLEEDKKQAFIDQCVTDAEKARVQRNSPT